MKTYEAPGDACEGLAEAVGAVQTGGAGGDRAGPVHKAGLVERGEGFEAPAARTDHYRPGGPGKGPRP
ncbi:hypothetical protein [Streptomyces sp. ME18-1-4]|uniref:hypothetical protein n=1 Tax=Streptomyces sp. ME18-1-4 TaxID=3028685 RepID=UPI0029A74613|nr:hypothetical protein [Streptomyces sp. ME18-1-4]MDX3245627.1 hypothetical protein [Streptomyces sp. ME18-1-4]